MSLALPRDVDVFRLMYGGPDGRLSTLCNALCMLGGGWAATALVPLAVWIRTRRLAVALTAAVAAQATIVWALKLAFGRVRPWIAFKLAAPIHAPHDGSFPSGHASGAFCVAVFLVLAFRVAWPQAVRPARLVSVGLFTVAALIALSRVYLGAHFPGDVVAGALIGALIGAVAGRVYASRERILRGPG